MIGSYEDMAARVDELGLMFLSKHPYGLASVSDETDDGCWFTGLESDPWQWKDRAAAERLLAYTKGITGRPAFISKKVLPYAMAYYGSAEDPVERYSYGEVSTLERDIYAFLDEDGKSVHDIKKQFMRNKKDERDVEAAIVRLQRSFDICTFGTRQKLALDGHPYGWPSMVYIKLCDWCPEAYEAAMEISGAEAEAYMRTLYLGQNPGLDGKQMDALMRRYV